MLLLLTLTACLITESDRAARLDLLRSKGDGTGDDGSANTNDSGGGSDGSADGGSDGGDSGTDDTSTPELVLDMVEIPLGEFEMGSRDEEVGHQVNENKHHVILNQAFSIGRTEVTKELYLAVTGDEAPSGAGCTAETGCPAAGLNWHDAAKFAKLLSEMEGLDPCYELSGGSGDRWETLGNPYECEGYRLPTEAEWEYAARAGVIAAYPNGAELDVWEDNCSTNDLDPVTKTIDEFAWYCANSDGVAHAVGTIPSEDDPFSNNWGLVDMSGNLSEWCNDWYTTDLGIAEIEDPTGPDSPPDEVYPYRVLRGGAYVSYPYKLRLAFRGGGDPTTGSDYTGFRIARTLK